MDAVAGLSEKTAEGPWALPEGWCWMPLKSLCSFIGRGRGPTYVQSDGVPVVNQKCVRWQRLEAQHFKFTSRVAYGRLSPELHLRAGDILWNSTGTGTIGRAVIYDGSFPELTVDSHVTIVRPSSIDPKYLGYLIETARVQHLVIDGHVGSTNQQELPRSFVEELLVPLAPVAEQRRIVARIDALFAEIAEGEAALAEARKGLDNFRRALLKAAVTGELTKDWRPANPVLEIGQEYLAGVQKDGATSATGKRPARSRGVEASATVALPSIPKSWAWAPLGDLILEIQAGLNVAAIGKPPENEETGIVKVSAVTWGEFDENASKTLPPAAKVDERNIIRAGDFLFSRANTLELVGAPVIVKKITKRLVLSDKVLRFVFADTMGAWIEIFLKSSYGRAQIEALATGAQLSMRNISQENIRKIMIALPPANEAAEILGHVKDALAAVADATIMLDEEAAGAARLRQSILKAAFQGRLVPHDPADEPASVLLTRLAGSSSAERTTRKRARKPTA